MNALLSQPESQPFTRFFALIPSGGSGSRAAQAAANGQSKGSGQIQPKQYRSIAGAFLIEHTLAAFAQVSGLQQCLIVVSPQDHAYYQKLRLPNAIFSVAALAGSTRALTVLNGLKALLEQGAKPLDWVLVHDAARCLVTPEQIQKVLDACAQDAVGGLMALPCPDTLKIEQSGRAQSTVHRADKWLAQTPQMFRIGALIEALQAAGDAVTDEASAMEALGLQPLLVAGSAQNFKVTYPEDFALAEALLLSRKNQA